MDSKTQNPAELVPATDPAPKVALAPDSGKTKRDFVSKGEHIHHWTTYLSVDWLLNAAAGVAFAFATKYTEVGKKFWSGPITAGFSKALKPLIKDPAQLEKSAGYGNMFMSIIAGGMFTIPPLMVLENNKVRKSFIKFYDSVIYGKEKAADPKFEKAYDEIENAPKKDFGSGLWARFAALAPLLAIVLIPATKKLSNKVWFNHVEKASEFVATKLGFSPEKSFKGVSPDEAKKRWKFIHESVAMDLGLGLPYAALHSFFYNRFASGKDKRNEPRDDTMVKKEKIDHALETLAALPVPPAQDKPSVNHAMRETNRRTDMGMRPAEVGA